MLEQKKEQSTSQKLEDFKHKEILTIAEAMQLLSTSRRSLDRMRKEGLIKVYKLRGRLYLKYSEIMEALENGLTEPA